MLRIVPYHMKHNHVASWPVPDGSQTNCTNSWGNVLVFIYISFALQQSFLQAYLWHASLM